MAKYTMKNSVIKSIKNCSPHEKSALKRCFRVPNENVAINHLDCKAGRDTKKRLYLSYNRKTSVAYFCHHCSKGGYLRRSTVERSLKTGATHFPVNTRSKFTSTVFPLEDLYKVISDTPYLSREVEEDISWATKTTAWPFLRKNGFKILCAKTTGKVYLGIPVLGEKLTLVGYQIRSSHSFYPKYRYAPLNDITRMDKPQCFIAKIPDPNRAPPEKIMLVEDALSAIHCAEYFYSKYRISLIAIALLGTTMKGTVVDLIVKRNLPVYVCLDDDNEEVIKKGVEIKKRLKALGVHVSAFRFPSGISPYKLHRAESKELEPNVRSIKKDPKLYLPLTIDP